MTAVLALVMALFCGVASAADRSNLPPAAANALAAVLANLESQARTGSETPAQLFQRSNALWTDLQLQMRTLGTPMADVPANAEPPEAVRGIDAVIVDVARAFARDPAPVHALLNRYGNPSAGSELKAAVLPRTLDQGDVVPDMMPTWLMLLMAPRIELADFARPRALQALSQLRARDALPLIELRANQDASHRARLPLDLGAMHRIDPSLALAAYARSIALAGDTMVKRPEMQPIYVQAVRDAIGQDRALGDLARAMATEATDSRVRDVFAAAIATP